MLCRFLFFCNLNFEELKNYIIENVLEKKIIRNYSNIEEIYENNRNSQVFDIIFDAFSFSLHYGGQGLKFMSEDYNMELNYSIVFEPYSDVPDWEEQMMILLGQIMKDFQMNCILLNNGSIPVMVRKNGRITIDESKTSRLRKLPYDLLKLDYLEEDIDKILE